MAWTVGETRTYTYDGNNTSQIVDDLEDGQYTVIVHGADGQGGSGGSYEEEAGVGGIGGFLKGTFTASSGDSIEIWVAESPTGNPSDRSQGGWGRSIGGVGVDGDGSSYGGSGGGSTEILLNNNFLAAADGGGGGSATRTYYTNTALGGSGGARGGVGGTASAPDGGDNGNDAEGTGNGGDGGSASHPTANDGEDGGQEAGSSLTVDTATTGGSQHPDGTENGYIELTYNGVSDTIGDVAATNSSGVRTTVSTGVVETDA